MLKPSYSELMEILNQDADIDNRITSRYAVVIAASKRARQIIDGNETYAVGSSDKAVSVAVSEMNMGYIKIIAESVDSIINIGPSVKDSSYYDDKISMFVDTEEGERIKPKKKTKKTAYEDDFGDDLELYDDSKKKKKPLADEYSGIAESDDDDDEYDDIDDDNSIEDDVELAELEELEELDELASIDALSLDDEAQIEELAEIDTLDIDAIEGYDSEIDLHTDEESDEELDKESDENSNEELEN